MGMKLKQRLVRRVTIRRGERLPGVRAVEKKMRTVFARAFSGVSGKLRIVARVDQRLWPLEMKVGTFEYGCSPEATDLVVRNSRRAAREKFLAQSWRQAP